MLEVRSRQLEKNFTINQKNLTQNQSKVLVFWGSSISKEGIAPVPKHVEISKNTEAPTNNRQLESFIWLANFYGRMIPDFETKMLRLNNKRNNNFSWGKLQQKPFEYMKNKLSAEPLVQPYTLQKEATFTTDASEKAFGGVHSQKRHPVLFVSNKLTPVEQNYTNIEQEALAMVFMVTRLN